MPEGNLGDRRLIAVLPKSGRFESLEDAVVRGGGEVAPISAARALVWADPSVPQDLPAVIDAASDNLEWVALPFAGIEPYVPYMDIERTWTCARGVYARPVAEHVMATALAGMRGLVHYSRQTSWTGPRGQNLTDAAVTIVGGGGIATELINLLQGWNCTITVVRRSGEPMRGAQRTFTTRDLRIALSDADLVVLAVALTPETTNLMSDREFEAMQDHAWLVNVARGGVVDTDALVRALRSGEIQGAALDVTNPEPLPETHPLWAEPGVLITPHVGNTPEMGVPLLAKHIEDNVKNFLSGNPLEGVVDVAAGY